jgi:hypothetical protein
MRTSTAELAIASNREAVRDWSHTSQDRLIEPPTEAERSSVVWQQVSERFIFFYRGAILYRRLYYLLRVGVLTAGALVPLFALNGTANEVTAACGFTIVIFEGLQQLFRAHETWIRHCTTAETLRREAFSYIARAGPYARVEDPMRCLAERVDHVISQENVGWSRAEQASESKGTGGKANE